MEKTENRTRWLGVLLLLTLFLILIVRCFFSFCQTDESFYAAMVNRLWTGDHLVWDEWNSTQFYTPLILPYYALFILIHGSTEGVILFLRLLYVLFAFLTAIKLFRLINHDTGNPVYSAAAASLVLIYSRANIQGPSYYNLCMLCCTSAFCSFAMALHVTGTGGQRGMLLWAGVLVACGVLCNPFLAPIVFLMVLLGLLVVRTRREMSAVLAGIVLMALIYCTYLAVTTGVSHFVEGLPYLFINPEQSNILQNMSISVHEAIHVSKYVAIPSVLMVIAVLGVILAWDQDSSVFRVVSFAWAGFGATFGPVMLAALFWKRSNKYGAITGMVAGGVMVFVWKFKIAPMGGVLAIYELLPAFVVASVCIVVVSLLTSKPGQEVIDEYDSVGHELHG